MGRRHRDPEARSDAKPGGKGLPPSQRPSKVCPTCGRPFSWRRKWAAVWEEVIYCSERCRRNKKPGV
jgi:hypothetical protein